MSVPPERESERMSKGGMREVVGGGVRRDPVCSLIALNQEGCDGVMMERWGNRGRGLRDGAARNIFTSSSDFYEF